MVFQPWLYQLCLLCLFWLCICCVHFHRPCNFRNFVAHKIWVTNIPIRSFHFFDIITNKVWFIYVLVTGSVCAWCVHFLVCFLLCALFNCTHLFTLLHLVRSVFWFIVTVCLFVHYILLVSVKCVCMTDMLYLFHGVSNLQSRFSFEKNMKYKVFCCSHCNEHIVLIYLPGIVISL